MLDSVQLRLLIGPIMPLTPPRAVMDALTEVEVKIVDVGQSGFKLTFSVDKQSPLQILFLLTGGLPLLFMRVVDRGRRQRHARRVLIDGVITDNNIAPGDKGSNSTLTIMGKDLTALMDQSKWSGFPFPAMPAEARIALLLLKYAVFGVIPLVIPSVLLFVPIPIEQIPSQQGTDLEYIRYLAESGRLRLLHRPGTDARHQQGLLGTADQGRIRSSPRSTPISTPIPTSRACASRSIRRRTRFR